MDILSLLQKSLESGALTQEEFDTAKSEIESRKFTQEDLNKHIADRVKREEEKYKPLTDEIASLKEKLGDKSLDDILTSLSEKDSQLSALESFKAEVEQKERQSQLNTKIDSLLGATKLPNVYRSMIELSDDEEALKSSVETVLNQFKNDLKESGLTPSIGGGAVPAQGNAELDRMDADALLLAGIKESRSQL